MNTMFLGILIFVVAVLISLIAVGTIFWISKRKSSQTNRREVSPANSQATGKTNSVLEKRTYFARLGYAYRRVKPEEKEYSPIRTIMDAYEAVKNSERIEMALFCPARSEELTGRENNEGCIWVKPISIYLQENSMLIETLRSIYICPRD